MQIIFRRWFDKGKSRIARRLDKNKGNASTDPKPGAGTIDYEVSERNGAISYGGIGAIQLMVKRLGLADAINHGLPLLKLYMPYRESDHVFNIAFNALCGGTCLQDIELRRNDENYLNALGVRRIPDPTTAGDFCRRFDPTDTSTLADIFNNTRLKVWAEQPDTFLDCATIDRDGTLTPTTGECKKGMDISYDGTWGYHPLLLTLAQTGEVLSIINRPGNRPSHEDAAREVDRMLMVCHRAGFRQIVLRGDTDFSQTERLDGWNYNPKIRFYFGYDAKKNLGEIADNLPDSAWSRLQRPARYTVKTQRRQRPKNVKEQVVKTRGFKNLRLVSEDVAEFDYQPTACRQSYRMVVIRKNISVEQGEQLLFPNDRYFFYITNDRECSKDDVVYEANDRCNQENLIAQLKNGVHALHAPVNDLASNGAYMLMTALAWNLKAWWALTLPEAPGRWQEKHRAEKQQALRMEFKTFLNAFILIPCQIIRTARKIMYRVLGWNPHLYLFFRLLHVLRN